MPHQTGHLPKTEQDFSKPIQNGFAAAGRPYHFFGIMPLTGLSADFIDSRRFLCLCCEVHDPSLSVATANLPCRPIFAVFLRAAAMACKALRELGQRDARGSISLLLPP